MRRGSPASWAAPERRAGAGGADHNVGTVHPSAGGSASLTCSAVEIVLALVIVAVVAWFVTAPLRRTPSQVEAAAARTEDPAVADLEARKEAKYREIRDAELDRQQGKLSQDDWRRQDAELRRDAIEILKALDETRSKAANPQPD